MPTGHDWDKVLVKDLPEMVKRVDNLSRGMEADLGRMQRKCRRKLHRPMCFVRNEKSQELYYICTECLSEYVIKHRNNRRHIVILRGRLNKKAMKALGMGEEE